MITRSGQLQNYTQSFIMINRSGQLKNYTQSHVMVVRSYGPSLGVMYYNNLGVIHLGMGKPTVACLYLQKALQETQVGEETNSSAHSGTVKYFVNLVNELIN